MLQPKNNDRVEIPTIMRAFDPEVVDAIGDLVDAGFHGGLLSLRLNL